MSTRRNNAPIADHHAIASVSRPPPLTLLSLACFFPSFACSRFGKPRHGFAKLTVQRKPFFDSPNLAHLLHRPQLKQYYRWKNNVLVRQNYERKRQSR